MVHPDGISRLSRGLLGKQAILSRGLCRFKLFNLENVPSRHRASALSMQLAQSSPFTRTGYYIAWQKHMAMVWCWDQAQLEGLTTQQGNRAISKQPIPETLIYRPQENGIRLINCHSGHEGQQWRDGVLIASRWWHSLPSQDEWVTFQRSCGIAASLIDAQVAPQPADNLKRPWKESSSTGPKGLLQNLEFSAYLALVAVFTCASTYYHQQSRHLEAQIGQKQARMNEIRKQAEPVLAAREAALNAASDLKAYALLTTPPSQIELMASLAKILPNDGSYLKNWRYNDGKLEFTLISPAAAISNELYVQAIDSTDWFRDTQTIANADPKQLGFVTMISQSGHHTSGQEQ